MRVLTFLACLAATLYMTGVIWTVQWVHYPLFFGVGKEGWEAYHAAHTARMTGVVLLPMTAELLTAGSLAFLPPSGMPRRSLLVGFLLTALTWAATGLIAIPLHNRLAAGFDADACQLLINTNWLRTLAWTGHALLLLELLRRLIVVKPAGQGEAA